MSEATQNKAVVVHQQTKAPVRAGERIGAMIPTDIDQAYRMAKAIANSGMTPKSYGNNPDKVFVGILAGAEVGLAPFQALQSIAVIGNMPAIWGDGALALVQASGLLVDIEETLTGSGEAMVATCRLVRKDRSTPIIRSFSMADAKRAALTGKDTYKAYPQRMLPMRARSWALRDGFADVLKGLQIAEEVRDYPASAMGGDQKPARLTSTHLEQQAGYQIEGQRVEPEDEADFHEVEQEDQSERHIETVADAMAEHDEINGTDDSDTDGPSPSDKAVQSLIERAADAADMAQLETVSIDLFKNKAGFDDAQINAVNDAMAAARARINKGK